MKKIIETDIDILSIIENLSAALGRPVAAAEIGERFKEDNDGYLDANVFQASITRLCKKGLVEWDTGQFIGPSCRVFRVTDNGALILNSCRKTKTAG